MTSTLFAIFLEEAAASQNLILALENKIRVLYQCFLPTECLVLKDVFFLQWFSTTDNPPNKGNNPGFVFTEVQVQSLNCKPNTNNMFNVWFSIFNSWFLLIAIPMPYTLGQEADHDIQ
jgi:hypothetical protein